MVCCFGLVGWLGWLGLKFLFENFQFLSQVLSWLVGLVRLLVVLVGSFFQLVVFLVDIFVYFSLVLFLFGSSYFFAESSCHSQ